MRWLHIDKFVSLEKGASARAVRNVTLAEDHLHDHMPGYPFLPASLIIESAAQTGGVLAGASIDFRSEVILAKVERARFHQLVRPGDQMVIDATLEDLREEGCRVEGRVSVDGRPVAEVSIIFAHLRDDQRPKGMRENFIFTREFLQLLQFNMPDGRPDTGPERGNA